jgi:peroxiredoxin
MSQLRYHIVILFFSLIFAQNDNVFPVTINEQFPDITLQSVDGKAVRVSDYRGKKVMLLFPRGKVTEEVWCPICHYQYLEMMFIEESENIKNKYNLEILFVLPYSSDSLASWINAIPASLQAINNWKYPQDEDNINENTRMWMEYSREFYPHSFDFNSDNFTQGLPILFDPERKVSEGLMLFREEWGGTKVPQNVPTIFILDEDGKVKYKYFSQSAKDRPDSKYIVKYLEKMF